MCLTCNVKLRPSCTVCTNGPSGTGHPQLHTKGLRCLTQVLCSRKQKLMNVALLLLPILPYLLLLCMNTSACQHFLVTAVSVTSVQQKCTLRLRLSDPSWHDQHDVQDHQSLSVNKLAQGPVFKLCFLILIDSAHHWCMQLMLETLLTSRLTTWYPWTGLTRHIERGVQNVRVQDPFDRNTFWNLIFSKGCREECAELTFQPCTRLCSAEHTLKLRQLSCNKPPLGRQPWQRASSFVSDTPLWTALSSNVCWSQKCKNFACPWGGETAASRSIRKLPRAQKLTLTVVQRVSNIAKVLLQKTKKNLSEDRSAMSSAVVITLLNYSVVTICNRMDDAGLLDSKLPRKFPPKAKAGTLGSGIDTVVDFIDRQNEKFYHFLMKPGQALCALLDEGMLICDTLLWMIVPGILVLKVWITTAGAAVESCSSVFSIIISQCLVIYKIAWQLFCAIHLGFARLTIPVVWLCACSALQEEHFF